MEPEIDYAELHCHSNFTFLEGASHPETLIERAAELGYRAIAITDRDGLYAAVRLQETARIHNIKPIFGAQVTLDDGSRLTLLVQNAYGYQNLSLLLTAGRRARPKGESAVTWEQLTAHSGGLIALTGVFDGRVPLALLQGNEPAAEQAALALLDVFGPGNVYLELTNHLLPAEALLRTRLVSLARKLDMPLVATQDVRYARPEGRRLQDVLTCIRFHTTLQQAADRLLPNGEYFLQTRAELARRFRTLPEALRNTWQIAERCQFELPQLSFDLPTFPVPAPYRTALEYLEHLTFVYAPARFPEMNAGVIQQLRHELTVIGRHQLEGYFLIVWDIMKFCHDQGILAQGRGSAANSAVCFALGITNVDPIHHRLLFERFLSEGRKEAPDIDLDIANDRREEVIQYVYERYGRDHTGMVCEIISYRARSAVREVGKALGLSLEQVDRLARSVEGGRFSSGARLAPSGPASVPPSGEEASTNDSTPLTAGSTPATGIAPAPATPAPAPALPGAAAPKAASVETAPPGENSASAGALVLPAGEGWVDREQLEPDASRGESVDGEAGGSDVASTPAPGEEPVVLTEQEARQARLLRELCLQIEGFPRHLGIHVGGMIISRSPLGALVPIENATMEGRTVVQWDKDDVAALKMPKIDLLGLGMLAMIGEALELVQVHERKVLDPARLTYDDPRVYELMCRADTVGVFQVESRAQMNVLPRLLPRVFYDLVVQVSLVRPGPIQGDMVHPYLRRRAGKEPVDYLHPDLKPILERTLGVPLFQEQGMKVAIAAAGFTAAEADALRRAMGSKRSHAQMDLLTQRLFDGMAQNGYSADIAQRIVNQIKAFSSYGFPESHAASFALIVYISAYLKCYHPVAFYTALLNNQPMGFYSPSTLVNEAKRKGIEVLSVDLCYSGWEWTIDGGRIRAGLKSVKGLGESHRAQWEDVRQQGPWRSVEDFCARIGWPRLYLERLAAVGAFSSLGVDRREALWRVQGHRERPGLARPQLYEPTPALPSMEVAESLTLDLKTVGHSTQANPTALMRETLQRWKVVLSDRLMRARYGSTVRVAGVVTVRQRPPTAKGFCFLTLEDERGMINVVIRPDKYDENRPVIRRSMLLLVEGVVQRTGGVVNIQAERFAALDERWATGLKSRDFH